MFLNFAFLSIWSDSNSFLSLSVFSIQFYDSEASVLSLAWRGYISTLLFLKMLNLFTLLPSPVEYCSILSNKEMSLRICDRGMYHSQVCIRSRTQATVSDVLGAFQSVRDVHYNLSIQLYASKQLDNRYLIIWQQWLKLFVFFHMMPCGVVQI